jgi:hypothetical protein
VVRVFKGQLKVVMRPIFLKEWCLRVLVVLPVLDLAILGMKSVIASRHFKSFVYIAFIHHVCCCCLSHYSIALSALKPLYVSYLSSHFSNSSAAFRNIAQGGGGSQVGGELLCHIVVLVLVLLVFIIFVIYFNCSLLLCIHCSFS